jgi:hypothetical protein
MWSLAARLARGGTIAVIGVYLCNMARMVEALRELDRLHLKVIGSRESFDPIALITSLVIAFTFLANSDFTHLNFPTNSILPISKRTFKFSARLAFHQKIRNHRTPFIFTLILLLRFGISAAFLGTLGASSSIGYSGTILDLELGKRIGPRSKAPVWIALSMFRLSNECLGLPDFSFLARKSFPVFA